MISIRRITASCCCVSVRKSVSVVSFTYDAIRRDASRMSRNRPSWSASMNADRSGENMLASKAVWGFSKRDVAQNPLEHLPVPLPPRPFRADRRSRRVMTRQALPASPHQCQVCPAHVRQNRIAPAGEYDVSCKTAAIAVVALPKKRACGDSFACLEGRRVIAFDQGGYDDRELPCSGVRGNLLRLIVVTMQRFNDLTCRQT